jgi:hypothetical protein
MDRLFKDYLTKQTEEWKPVVSETIFVSKIKLLSSENMSYLDCFQMAHFQKTVV